MDVCPNCGAELPPNARACPECGSDEQTGWSERAAYQQLGVPDPDFNYEEFVKEEFGTGPRARPRTRWRWAVVALVLLAAWLAWLF